MGFWQKPGGPSLLRSGVQLSALGSSPSQTYQTHSKWLSLTIKSKLTLQSKLTLMYQANYKVQGNWVNQAYILWVIQRFKKAVSIDSLPINTACTDPQPTQVLWPSQQLSSSGSEAPTQATLVSPNHLCQ